MKLELTERNGLPEALRVLAEAYPRAQWEAHPNFGDLVHFWMQRHLMFRELVSVLRDDAETAVAGDLDLQRHASRLAQYGGTLLNELHMHHRVEDHHYFPQLIKLDVRLERGFELLESDHETMDGLLHDMAQWANAVLQGGETGVFLDRLNGFAHLLERHLTDEEEIVVPVILDTGFNG